MDSASHLAGITPLGGRAYARPYRVSGRADLLEMLCQGIEASGGRVLYTSEHTRAPVILGVEDADQSRLALLCYLFRATGRQIRHRPQDEHRLQLRLGGERGWDGEHPLAFDPAGADVTLVLGLNPEEGYIIGLDPLIYSPMPLGISVAFKEREVERIKEEGWHVWVKDNRAGSRRVGKRASDGLETLVGLRPERLLDYARFERDATALGLDPILRLQAAQRAAVKASSAAASRHQLEEALGLDAAEILDLIEGRNRLLVAVRGGVAERHLLKALQRDPEVLHAEEVDGDQPPDVEATMAVDCKPVRVECKNGKEDYYANGDGHVELQKTRGSKDAPETRLYLPEQFDVLAVALWPKEGPPRFVYRCVEDLPRHAQHSDRLAVHLHIDDSWATSLAEALA